MTIRSFNEINLALIDALPSTEEIRAFSDVQLGLLGNLANMLDNMRHFERVRRDGEAGKDAEVKS